MEVKNKPLHENHCNHPPEDFIESHAGSDLYAYESPILGRCYSIRHSSEESDYSSSFSTLADARWWAEVRAKERGRTENE
jgi:hypothetical protein